MDKTEGISLFDSCTPKPTELRGESHAQTSRVVLLRNNLLAATLIFVLLQFWRPYFFLTDDNLDGALPGLIGIGENLLSGQSPFICHYLFGGHYDQLRDPCCFVWHPVYLIASLLAGTPFRFAIVDVVAFCFFMLTVAGFVNLVWYLRRELSLGLSDGWLMFYTLSYTYSIFSLTTGASWVNFLGNHSALPWLVLGILQTNWRYGIGLVTLFSLHQLLGGHLSPTFSSSIFLSLFALGVSLCRRSILPLAWWLAGYTLALVTILPLFIPSLEGFFASNRSHGITWADMQANNIPFISFPVALFFGAGLWLISVCETPHVTYTFAMVSCAAAWCLVPALSNLRTKWGGLEKVCLAMMILIGFLVCRPLWVTQILLHLPLLKSMRWPFRELMQFLFFLHLFLVLRTPALPARTMRRMGILGATLMIVPLLLFYEPPRLNPMTWDRELILSGQFDQYWEKVRPLLKPSDRIAVLIPYSIHKDEHFYLPYCLLGSYNFAIMARVINASGDSSTAPQDQLYTKIDFYPFGAFAPEQKQALLEEHPDLKFITLESLKPLKITLSSQDQPAVDLTPLIPPDARRLR